MYKLKFTLLQQEILRFLSINAGLSFNARRLSQKLDVSQTAIAKSLPLLEKEKLVKIVKDSESGRLAIELNRENKLSLQLKRTENLKLIYESGLADFLKQKFPDAEIMLFGLFSRGEDIHSSEIDILIKGSKKKLDLAEFEMILEKHVNLVFYNSTKKINHKILTEGILL